MPVSNASLEDEDCSVITDWVNEDQSPAESTQVTFDGKSCFRFDTNEGAAGNDTARRRKDIGSINGLGNRIVFSLKTYCDAIGPQTNDCFYTSIRRSDWAFIVHFQSDGLFINDGVTITEVGTNLVVQDTWQEWTFDIDLSGGVANAVCDVYLDNILKESDVDCSKTGTYNDGYCYLIMFGYNTDHRIGYVDWFKVGDSFLIATMKINIGDVFKDVTEMKINIGDNWKTVTEMKINIGDVWKTIF